MDKRAWIQISKDVLVVGMLLFNNRGGVLLVLLLRISYLHDIPFALSRVIRGETCESRAIV